MSHTPQRPSARRYRRARIHDEHVDDWLYSEGWSMVSSQTNCAIEGCECDATGACDVGVFNHYMVVDVAGSPASDTSAVDGSSSRQPMTPRDITNVTNGERSLCFDFPLCLSEDTAEMVGVEEVRCRPHTVGVAYRYYRANVIQDHYTTTMVSVVIGDYKSTCFNMECYILEMPLQMVPEGCVAMDSGTEGMCWVLAMDENLSAKFLESLCNVDISPIVLPTDTMRLALTEGGIVSKRVSVSMSSFGHTESGPNILWHSSLTPTAFSCAPNRYGVSAVRTALVTLSVLLTPKSMYGGKNPTTKEVTYFIHNICCGEETLDA